MGDRALMIGAILVGLIVAAIVWFVAISPKLSSAQEARDATVAQIDGNVLLEDTLAERKLSAENVPDYTREIYKIRDILSPVEDIPALRRTIDDIMSGLGLSVKVENVTPPGPVLGGLSLLAPMAEVGLTSEIEGMQFSTLQATFVNIEIEGTLSQVCAVIDLLQSGEHRYMLVTNLTLTASGEGSEDKFRATIQAAIFTLDNGVDGLTVRPDERPWPGTEEETLETSSESVNLPVPSGEG
jgi:hypothetical protein